MGTINTKAPKRSISIDEYDDGVITLLSSNSGDVNAEATRIEPRDGEPDREMLLVELASRGVLSMSVGEVTALGFCTMGSHAQPARVTHEIVVGDLRPFTACIQCARAYEQLEPGVDRLAGQVRVRAL